MFDELALFLLTNIITFLFTFHLGRLRQNRQYRDMVFKNFDTINKHIKIIVSALSRSNGFGERFEEEYIKELESHKLKDVFDV